MNTTVFSLLVCVLSAHCAIYKTKDEKLSRIARSPHFTKSDSGDSSIVFRTQNWSGVARGAQGVFSGAAAAAGSVVPAANEAFSIAASGAAPVKDKLEERFGGSDHSDSHYIHLNPSSFYNPYIPDHHGDRRWGYEGYGHDFHKDFSGYQRGSYDYGQLNSGANNQAFAKSEASSNANSLSKSQATSYPFTSGQSNEGYGSGSYANQGQLHQKLNVESNGIFKSTAESKTFTQSASLNRAAKQIDSHGKRFDSSQDLQNFRAQEVESNGNEFGSSQGYQNAHNKQVESCGNEFGSSQGLQNGGGLPVESHGNEFGSSQSLQNGGGQQVESHDTGFGSSKSYQNDHSQQVESHGNGFGSSQSLLNGDGQQVQSNESGFNSVQGFQNADGHIAENQGKGFGGDQSQISSYGFNQHSGNGDGSQSSRGFELGTGTTNDNKHDLSGFSGSSNVGGGFTGQDQKYAYGSSKYQAGIQFENLQSGGISGKSSGSDGGLINSANSNNGQESLSLNSGSSGHEDLQSTLSGALGLASQGLQASQNQPCSTCQKSSYAFSNAKSHSGSAVALSIGG